MNMFNFKEFIENLKELDEKKDIVEKYEKLVEPLTEDFKDTIIFKDYLSKFDVDWIDLLLPEYIDEDFDFELLLRLVISSFSSSYVLEKNEETWKIELIINVSAWEKHVAKKLSELWGFQIARMYEIYIEEQMNLEILAHEDEKEKDIVLSQRAANIDKWKLTMENLKVKELKEKEESEKNEKLDDLMNQL